MKKIYWRPERISRRVLLIIALFAIAGMLSVETFKVEKKQPFFKEKLAAARLSAQAFAAVKEARLEKRIRIDKEADPAQSGLIGQLMSPTTTNTGHLPAKQTSINPNFAAVIVHMLKRADVEKGGIAGLGLSGSFPALNIAAIAAVEAIGAEPVIISSIGASQWGANIPRLLWPDMEDIILARKIIHTRSSAYSLGGVDDRALGLSKNGKEALKKAIENSGVPRLEITDYNDSVEKRIQLYRQAAGEKDIAVYINVGGGTSSVGTRVGKKLFKPGLNRAAPRGLSGFDSVMSRFILDGVPVIHISSIDAIAEKYGLPLQPVKTPKPGEGKVFRREVYNIPLAAGVLAMLIIMLWIFARLDLGVRLLSNGNRRKDSRSSQQMV
jgi:poly-gamma-glutamate system protein